MTLNHDVPRKLSLAAALMAIACLVSPARADNDPPTRVGRISLIENGSVSFRPNPGTDWQQAVVNYPVAQSMSLWSDNNARAEVEIGEAVVRLDAQTELDVAQLDDNTVVLSVPQGRIDVTLHNKWADERYAVQTPSGSVDLLDNASYRIIAQGQGQPTRFAAFNGGARISGPAGGLTLRPGDEAISDPRDSSGYDVEQASEDGFDQWSSNRDRAKTSQGAPQYVPPYPGAEALGNYGVWRNVPDYGHVWIPTDVGDGWAPYHNGHWVWIDPWGWTWVDDAPWGFAPFHYGRWAMIDGTWGWIPVDPDFGGNVRFRPRYSPALVSFIGDPGELGFSVGIGAVGWVALGPREPFHPWYRSSDHYQHDVNVFNMNRNFVDHGDDGRRFANQRFITVVPRQSFAEGRAVNREAMGVPQAAFDRPFHAGVNAVNVLPSREAFDNRQRASFAPQPHGMTPPTPGNINNPGFRPQPDQHFSAPQNQPNFQHQEMQHQEIQHQQEFQRQQVQRQENDQRQFDRRANEQQQPNGGQPQQAPRQAPQNVTPQAQPPAQHPQPQFTPPPQQQQARQPTPAPQAPPVNYHNVQQQIDRANHKENNDQQQQQH